MYEKYCKDNQEWGCPDEYTEIVFTKEHKIEQEKIDKELEQLWEKLGDVPFVEGEDHEMYLDVNWQGWDKGTDRDTIWYWFDAHHSKGVGWLMNEYKG